MTAEDIIRNALDGRFCQFSSQGGVNVYEVSRDFLPSYNVMEGPNEQFEKREYTKPKPWTEAEDAILVNMKAQKFSVYKISTRLDRGYKAVTARWAIIRNKKVVRPQPPVRKFTPSGFLTLQYVMNVVIEETGIERNALMSPRRNKNIVTARMLFSYAARQFTTQSLVAIGKCIDKDHSTVVHSVQTVEGNPEKFGMTLANIMVRLSVEVQKAADPITRMSPCELACV